MNVQSVSRLILPFALAIACSGCAVVAVADAAVTVVATGVKVGAAVVETIVVVAGYFGALYLVRRQRKAKRATLEHQMAAVQQQYRKEVRRLRDQCQKISERIAQQKQIADAPH